MLRNIKTRDNKEKANIGARLPTGVTGRPTVDANRNQSQATATYESDPLPFTTPTTHYHISDSTRHHENITAWLAQNSGDPAIKVFPAIFYLLKPSQAPTAPFRTSSLGSKITYLLGS